MTPLFVSYVGSLRGKEAQGWVALDYPPLVTPDDLKELATKLEDMRGYDPGTLVLVNFRRLEHT